MSGRVAVQKRVVPRVRTAACSPSTPYLSDIAGVDAAVDTAVERKTAARQEIGTGTDRSTDTANNSSIAAAKERISRKA